MTQFHPQQSAQEDPALQDLPIGRRLTVLGRACSQAARERRTKRALFFASASVAVGFTVAGSWGVLVCGIFGGSMYLVVLALRMQRHIRTEVERSRAEDSPIQ
ncbi:MAG: putative membrane protein [Candidatus Paceibacteria bacterium]|jgi:uncharacterized membrane protein